jgi:Protein of unknown function (DUF1552)
MSKPHAFSLSRRAALTMFGSLGALPLLDAMFPGKARADAAVYPRRFVVFFSSCGTIAQNWTPTGGERDFQLSPILSPLEPFRDDIVVIQGVDQQGGGGGGGHQAGMGGMLTGNGLNPGPFSAGDSSSGWASSLSVDQRIANAIGDDTAFKSVELGVQVGLADNMGRMCYAASDRPVPPEDDPYRAFDRVFFPLTRDPAELARIRAHRLSVLDRVAGRFERLSARLGASDRQKVAAHLSSIREIESRLAVVPTPRPACQVPALDAGIDLAANDSFPLIGKLQMDLLVMSLACDLTRVASLQWSRSASGVRFTWLHLNDLHHDLSHRGDNDTDAIDKLTRINQWYAQQLAYLIGRMKQIPEGDGTLLDNTVILWCNELAKGNVHGRTDAPYVLAGRAGGALSTGRFLQFEGNVPHNNLLLSLIHAMGQDDTSFGNPDWCTGPLTGLL